MNLCSSAMRWRRDQRRTLPALRVVVTPPYPSTSRTLSLLPITLHTIQNIHPSICMSYQWRIKLVLKIGWILISLQRGEGYMSRYPTKNVYDFKGAMENSSSSSLPGLKSKNRRRNYKITSSPKRWTISGTNGLIEKWIVRILEVALLGRKFWKNSLRAESSTFL